jgi:hypothetical protein
MDYVCGSGEKTRFFKLQKREEKEEKGERFSYLPRSYVAVKIEPKSRYSTAKTRPKS